MRYTDNLNLKKPEQTEFYDVDDFNENADKIDAEMMKRLPLSGGTMTGTIVQEQDVALSRSVDNSSIHITGSRNGNTGACLTLFGKASAQYQGCFALTTEDSNQNYKQLIGKPTGELLWGEDKIITSAGGTVNGSLMLNTLLAPNDKTYMSLYGGTGWQKGSALILGGVENGERKGSFELTARSDTSHLTTLYGHADGRLKWNDKNIVRSVNNVLASGDGNVDLPVATAETYGLVRVAKPTDVLDTVEDAAITPAVYHDVSDFRHKGTAYNLGDKVECMFNHELFLECTKAGTTANTPLDTRNVKHGQELTDGGVQWTVRTHIKSVNGVVAGADGDVTVPQISASEIVNIVYPIGSLYWSKNSTNPTTLFGGTWVQIKDKFILAAGDTYKVGTTGGEAAHTLTIAELPAHNHTGTAANTALHGAIDTTDNNENARRCGTGDGTGILSSREDGSVFRYGKDGFVSAPTGIKINATHSHTISINNTGNGVAHNNMPPYVTYYCWERTA